MFGHPNIRYETATPTSIPPNINNCTYPSEDRYSPSNVAKPQAPERPSAARISLPVRPSFGCNLEVPLLGALSPSTWEMQKNKKKTSENPSQRNANPIENSSSVMLSGGYWGGVDCRTKPPRLVEYRELTPNPTPPLKPAAHCAPKATGYGPNAATVANPPNRPTAP